jgi:hypothetical protein
MRICFLLGTGHHPILAAGQNYKSLLGKQSILKKYFKTGVNSSVTGSISLKHGQKS